MAGRGGNRRPTWGVGRRERRDSVFESRPSRARARTGGRGERARETRRTRGRGRRGPGEAETWARRRLRARRRAGIGGRRETGPTGGPHLSATPGGREAGGRLPGWASACGRPSKEEGEEKGKWADGPFDKKDEKKERQKKKKKKKDFSLELKYCLLNFNWLKLFLEL